MAGTKKEKIQLIEAYPVKAGDHIVINMGNADLSTVAESDGWVVDDGSKREFLSNTELRKEFRKAQPAEIALKKQDIPHLLKAIPAKQGTWAKVDDPQRPGKERAFLPPQNGWIVSVESGPSKFLSDLSYRTMFATAATPPAYQGQGFYVRKASAPEARP